MSSIRRSRSSLDLACMAVVRSSQTTAIGRIRRLSRPVAAGMTGATPMSAAKRAAAMGMRWSIASMRNSISP